MFWAFPKDMRNKWYASCVQMVNKLLRGDLGPFKHNFCLGFWQMERAASGRPPKVGATASGRRPHFGISICQQPKRKMCLNGPRSPRDHCLTISTPLLYYLFSISFGKAQNHFHNVFDILPIYGL